MTLILRRATSSVVVFCLVASAVSSWVHGRDQHVRPSATRDVGPTEGATHFWSGMIRVESTWTSNLQGATDMHHWTAEFYVLLAEVPTTSFRSGLENGQLADLPVNNLLPLQLDYRIEGLTVDMPSTVGPVEGGYVMSGEAQGQLRGDTLSRSPVLIPARLQGSLNRLSDAQPPTPAVVSINSAEAHSVSQTKTVETPGGYEIFLGLTGQGDWSGIEEKALYDGFTILHLPCKNEGHNRVESQTLSSVAGFIARLEISNVAIFGTLTHPEQAEISGSHSFPRFDTDSTLSPPQISINWNLKRVAYRGVRIYYRQQAGAGFIGPTLWLPHNEFVDFLIGHRQPPIDVQIHTFPAGEAIQWTLTPEGNHSGRINPSRGTSKEFSFTPDVRGLRPTQGSRRPNQPIGYTLTVHKGNGLQLLARETIRQDAISVLRQEYVDYRRQTDTRSVNFGLVPPGRDRFGPAQPLGGNFTILDGRAVIYGNYDPVTLNGGWRQMATNTQRAYGGVIDLNSAYRNPQRNTVVNGAALSIHMTGGAVDMDMTPQTVPDMVRLHRAALTASGGSEILLERAGGGAGGTILLPKNWRPPSANHRFVVGNSTIIVGDSDGDDLPDRVEELLAEPPGGIRSRTNLPYAGGGTGNPHFRVRDTNRNGRIDPMEPLVLVHPLDDVASNLLDQYYRAATHVHCATAELPREQSR